MAVLVDYTQIAIAAIIQFSRDLKNEQSTEEKQSLIRHIVLSSILSQRKKFPRSEYGDLLICCDNRNYWRREIFPYYKAGRKKARDKSDFDWKFVFDTLNLIKGEIRDVLPYKIIDVHGAEADDVIGVLTKYFQTNETRGNLLEDEPQDIVILSSDGDHLQLQKYCNVKQWSPMAKKFIKPTNNNAREFLIEKICCGDPGDGYGNILSCDDVFVNPEKRQTAFRKSRLEEFFLRGEEACKTADELRNYHRNRQLADYECIPDDVAERILNEYKSYRVNNQKAKILTYFVKYKLKNLISNIEEF